MYGTQSRSRRCGKRQREVPKKWHKRCNFRCVYEKSVPPEFGCELVCVVGTAVAAGSDGDEGKMEDEHTKFFFSFSLFHVLDATSQGAAGESR